MSELPRIPEHDAVWRAETEISRLNEALLRGVAPLVVTTHCLKRPASKLEPWDGPCGKCAPCMAKDALALVKLGEGSRDADEAQA